MPVEKQLVFYQKNPSIVAITLTFEIIQTIFAIGRTDITDVLSNALDGLIGIGIYTLAFKLMKRRPIKF